MEQPKRFVFDDKRNLVFHLTNALYGLKQAPLEWNKVIEKFSPDKLGISRSSADVYVYIKRENGHVFLVALYEDDFLVAASYI